MSTRSIETELVDHPSTDEFDDEQSTYEEEASRSKAIQGRRHTHKDDSSSDSEHDDTDEDNGVQSKRAFAQEDKDSDIEDYFVGENDEEDGGDDSEDDGNASDAKEAAASQKKKQKAKPLSEKEILAARNKEAKSGVVYMSRVPPFMKPVKVRHMLKKYAEIGRVYFIEEDEQKRKRRVKNGGNRRKLFVEGWIEFANKKYAKAVAQMLNNTPMGGKKHGFYHDDLWNLKYLPKFKWRHLVDQLASEQAAKQQRLQSEVSQSRRELDAYMKNVDRAKKMTSIKSKRDAKIEKGENVEQFEVRSRNVWQRDVVVRESGGTAEHAQSASANKRRRTQQSTNIASVLDHIF